MNQKNKVQLAGRLGMDPEVRTTANGMKMAKLSLAVNESYKNQQGDWVKQTQWFNIVAWGKMAQSIADNCSKGSEVLIEGRLLTREYTDKTGAKKRSMEIHAQNIVRVEKDEMETA